MQLIMLVTVLLLLAYIWKGVAWILEEQMDRESQKTKLRTQLRALGLDGDEEVQEPELPKWSLL